MMTRLTVATAVTEFHATAASIENWMLDAEGEHDAHLTAQAIANAATETLEAVPGLWAMYAEGFDVDTRLLRVSISALRNVLAWTNSVARIAA